MIKRPSLGTIAALAVAAMLALGGTGWWYRTSRPEYRFRTGEEAARTGNFERAERNATALEEGGQTDLALLLRGEIAYHQADAARGMAYVNQIKGEGEIRVRGAVLAARCMIALKNPREAEKALYFVLNQAPDNIEAHRWLAVIYYDQGDFKRTIPHLEEVAKLDPKDERPHFLLGSIHKDMEEADEAVKAFKESLRRRPAGPQAIETREALAEAQIKNYQEADALKTLQGLDSAKAVALKAEAMITLGRAVESVSLLDEALAKFPDTGSLMRLRGERYRDAGDQETAAKLLERVIALDPQDYRSRSQLALCYNALDRTKEGEEQNKKAKATQDLIEKVHDLGNAAMKDPWDAATRDQLAVLFDQLNRPQMAKMWRIAAAACRAPRPPR